MEKFAPHLGPLEPELCLLETRTNLELTGRKFMLRNDAVKYLFRLKIIIWNERSASGRPTTTIDWGISIITADAPGICTIFTAENITTVQALSENCVVGCSLNAFSVD